jgi:hypothetical protein
MKNKEKYKDIPFDPPIPDNGNLRDIFAAKAMHAEMINEVVGERAALTYKEIAKRAYKQADAMMEERER